MRRLLAFILAAVVLTAVVLAYLMVTPTDLPPVPPVPPAGDETATATPGETPEVKRDRILIEVAGSASGTIEIELFNDLAPKHAARIVALAKAGKYDNVVFHRVIGGFMAQTGDVRFGVRGGGGMARVGTGGSDLPDLKAEISNQQFVAGIVGMARGPRLDSANSQFFIMTAGAQYLDSRYTAVGRVISGQDVVNAIKKGEQARNGAVDDPDYMKTVRVE